MPLVGRPIELIIPHSSSATRGGGLPMRNSRDTVFATSAPSRLMSITWARSVEKAPEAGIIGFFRVTFPIFTDMSTIRQPPADRTPGLRYTRAAAPSCRSLRRCARTRSRGRARRPSPAPSPPARAAGEERIGELCRDEPFDDALDILDVARAVGVEHRHRGADLAEQVVRHHEFAAARREDRGDADALLAG